MKTAMPLIELIGQIDKTRELARKNRAFYRLFLEKDFPKLGKGTAAAMVISQIITDYYTVLETLFMRISQFFENSLSEKEWHKDLLEKMTIRIEGVRESVISDATCQLLQDLLRFRHFRRYYFEHEYDWDRIALVQKKYADVETLLERDLRKFQQFLRKLIDHLPA